MKKHTQSLLETIFSKYGSPQPRVEREIKTRIESAFKVCFNAEPSGLMGLEHPKDEEYGDYALSVFPFVLELKKSPEDIGKALCAELSKDSFFKDVQFAAPGFINFFLSTDTLQEVLQHILQLGSDYGKNSYGSGKRLQLEFISANPTGPLTFPNARGGFTGDVLANIYALCGFEVAREYYINDYGNQVLRLGASVFHEYELLRGNPSTFPEDGYKGEYIKDIAQELYSESTSLSLDEVTQKSLEKNIASAKHTVDRMGIHFDVLKSEKSLHDDGLVDAALKRLKQSGKVYEKEGALWLKTTEYHDDKDRVLIKSGGETTYIMGDLAYHIDKFDTRGFDYVINIWGADHHGDVARLHAGLHFLGVDDARLQIILIALMKMKKDGAEVKISKRAGTYILMNDVLDTVPLDVLRFFSLMYDVKSPMTFDLDLALDTSDRNPVYYVQYAHARMCSIIEKAPADFSQEMVDYSLLTDEELHIVKKLIIFEELIIASARSSEAHLIPHYAVTLAKAFHAFYHHFQVISDDVEVSKARLAIVKVVRIVLKNTLDVMGVSAPEKM